ncbi:MAG TPA: hypothetical protein VK964_19830 [Nocardioidaceae bacterium]|nr:hypothetical protein [Nocardioidaceae bacterium]
MSENKSRYVLLCQQLLTLGTVAALAAPATGVVSLDIVGPPPEERPMVGQGVTPATGTAELPP